MVLRLQIVTRDYRVSPKDYDYLIENDFAVFADFADAKIGNECAYFV